MRYIEIVPKNGSHYLVVPGLDGKPVELCRHNSVAIAEQVRAFWMAEEVKRRESVQRGQEREAVS